MRTVKSAVMCTRAHAIFFVRPVVSDSFRFVWLFVSFRFVSCRFVSLLLGLFRFFVLLLLSFLFFFRFAAGANGGG